MSEHLYEPNTNFHLLTQLWLNELSCVAPVGHLQVSPFPLCIAWLLPGANVAVWARNDSSSRHAIKVKWRPVYFLSRQRTNDDDDDDDDNLAHNKIQFYVQIDTLWKTGG